jgi:hypothetical protein
MYCYLILLLKCFLLNAHVLVSLTFCYQPTKNFVMLTVLFRIHILSWRILIGLFVALSINDMEGLIFFIEILGNPELYYN